MQKQGAKKEKKFLQCCHISDEESKTRRADMNAHDVFITNALTPGGDFPNQAVA